MRLVYLRYMQPIRYIDIHAHLNLSAFNEDREDVLVRTSDAGVAHINVGTKESTSARAVEIAQSHEGVHAIVGLHPIQTTPQTHDEDEIGEGGAPFISKGEVFNKDFYRELCKSKKVVAIGECGLDYYHNDPDTRAIQEEQFIAQIELANELQLPLMIHVRNAKEGTRDAYADVHAILKQYAKVPGDIHFYAGSYGQSVSPCMRSSGALRTTSSYSFAKVMTPVNEIVNPRSKNCFACSYEPA